MSAFIVEDKTINCVVNYLAMARRHGSLEYHGLMKREFLIDMGNPKEVEGLAVAMFRLNCDAVEQRYGKGEAAQFRDLDFKFKPTETLGGGMIIMGAPPSPLQVYKSLGCWLYQCAEGNIPETSLLYQAMTKVKAEIAMNIVESSTAYDQAAWG